MYKKVHGDLFIRPTVKGSEVKKGQICNITKLEFLMQLKNYTLQIYTSIYILEQYDLKNMSVIVSMTLYKA